MSGAKQLHGSEDHTISFYETPWAETYQGRTVDPAEALNYGGIGVIPEEDVNRLIRSFDLV